VAGQRIDIRRFLLAGADWSCKSRVRASLDDRGEDLRLLGASTIDPNSSILLAQPFPVDDHGRGARIFGL
jgi:hypothetical protein